MAWDPDQSPKDLAQALKDYDFARAAELVDNLVRYLRGATVPYPEASALVVRKALQKTREFQLLRVATDALIQSGNGSFLTRVAHAQALIEIGALTASGAVLDDLLNETQAAKTGSGPLRAKAGTAYFEVCGLIGRMNKQRYVDAAAPTIPVNSKSLLAALEAYYTVYYDNPGNADCRWHGVNALALAVRAEADGVVTNAKIDPRQLATELVEAIEADHTAGNASMWDFAVALEASLWTVDPAQAFDWCRLYLRADVGAFELGSTLRQLTTVWPAPARSTIAKIIERLAKLIKSKLVALPGGRINFDANEAGAERRGNQGTPVAGFIDADVYRLGLERARSIARITPIGQSQPHTMGGTGVLVQGSALHPSFGSETLLLTCSHVVSEGRVPWRRAMAAEQACVELLFGADPSSQPFQTTVQKVVWQTGAEIDACVLRLRELPKHVKPCPIQPAQRTAIKSIDRVFVAGYPISDALDDTLQFSLYDNLVIDSDDRALQYRAATLPGSSGSPVFDKSWNVVALHQRGGAALARLSGKGTHRANEGTLISAIIAAIAADLGQSRLSSSSSGSDSSVQLPG